MRLKPMRSTRKLPESTKINGCPSPDRSQQQVGQKAVENHGSKGVAARETRRKGEEFREDGNRPGTCEKSFQDENQQFVRAGAADQHQGGKVAVGEKQAKEGQPADHEDGRGAPEIGHDDEEKIARRMVVSLQQVVNAVIQSDHGGVEPQPPGQQGEKRRQREG